MNHPGTDNMPMIQVKEFEKNDLSIRIKVPPLYVEQTAEIVLSVFETKKGTPLTDAYIDLTFDEMEEGISETIQLEGSDEYGDYIVEYRPATEGVLEITVEIFNANNQSPVTLKTRAIVMADGPHGISKSTKYIFGGIIMGIVMLFLMGRSWH